MLTLGRRTASPRQQKLRRAAIFFGLASVYVGTAKVGLMLGAVSGFATLVWPPTGVALAALMALGISLWPAVMVGAFLANLWNGAPVLVALGISVGNTLEAVIATLLLARCASPFSLDRVRDLAYFIAVGAVLSTVVSAGAGVGSLVLGSVITSSEAWPTFRAWWTGDALGDLVVAPALLALRTPVGPSLRGKLIEVTLLLLSISVVATLIFFNEPTLPTPPLRMPFMLFPAFTWGALRFGINGAVLTTLMVSAIAITATTLGFGPYVRETLAVSLSTLQTYMGVLSSTMLLFGAAISDRLRAIRAREEILAVVSHDLKNPLSSIRLSTIQLRKVLHAERDAKARISVRIVERSVLRMERLIRDLLDLATLDTGHLVLDCKMVALRTIVNEASDMIRSLADGKTQFFSVSVDENDSTHLTCDRERILQVLSNLLGNAVKFTPEGGAIALRAKTEGPSVKFWVEDTGTGIPPAELRHVFDRYWKAKPTLHDGSGLGLSIAKGIVIAHGGRIWATSAVGKGSTFCFTLPLSGPLGRSQPSGPKVSPSPSRDD